MDKKIENLIEAAKRAIDVLKNKGDCGTIYKEALARSLDSLIDSIEFVDLVKRLKHIKFVLEDPQSQFLLIDDNLNRSDLLEVVDYYLNLHKSE